MLAAASDRCAANEGIYSRACSHLVNGEGVALYRWL